MIELNQNVASLEASPAFEEITKVVLIVGTDSNGIEHYYEAGDDAGRTLTVDCPWATQKVANNLLNQLDGFIYQPYSAKDALLDPAAELGDEVSVGGVISQLWSIATTFDALYTADIKAPQDEEIDHEYPYEPNAERSVVRKAATITASLRIEVDGIVSEVADSGVWDEEGYQINNYGFTAPDASEFPPSEYSGEYYLNKTNGYLYASNGTSWTFVKAFTSMTTAVSTVRQTASKIDWIVASGTSASNFTMTQRSIDLVAANINLTGYVTFSDLSTSGSTTIVGDNVTSGTIRGCKFVTTGEGYYDQDSVYYVNGIINNTEQEIGYLSFDSRGSGTEEEAANRLILATNSGYPLKIRSEYANLSIEAPYKLLYEKADKILLDGRLVLRSDAWGNSLPSVDSSAKTDNLGRVFFLTT